MAQGDFVVFAQAKVSMQEALIDLETDSFFLALVTNATVPSETTADPRWGAGGSTDFSANEVSGDNYTTGGNALLNPTISLATATTKWDTDDPTTWSQAAGGPTDIRWGIIYDSTDAGKRAVGYVEMTTGTDISLVAGDISVAVAAGGWYTVL